MTTKTRPEITIFCSCSDEDQQEWQEELKKRLSIERLNVAIKVLDRHGIALGALREEEIKKYIDQADIILLLISSDFLADKHYFSTEVQYILQLPSFVKNLNPTKSIATIDSNATPATAQQYAPAATEPSDASQSIPDNASSIPDDASSTSDTFTQLGQKPYIIPIRIRPISLNNTIFSGINILPRDTRPLSSLKRDEAFAQVIYEIEILIEKLIGSTSNIDHPSGTLLIDSGQIYVAKLPPPNDFFTGRKEALNQLRSRFTRPTTNFIMYRQALRGLGGIGKTQLAIKYAHLFRQHYKQVFFINADKPETLTQEYAELAQHLQLPERHNKDQNEVVKAVKTWLERNFDWLLILDNADDLNHVHSFIPYGSTNSGHVILTMREQALGTIAEGFDIIPMGSDEGMLFLLVRAKKIPPNGSIHTTDPVNVQYARDIAERLGGLPLALDHAGAYLEETGEELGRYLQLYENQPLMFLAYESVLKSTHPEPVVKTFSIAFERVERIDRIAADILRLCAFLAPDNIPDAIIIDYFASLATHHHAPNNQQAQKRRGLGDLLRLPQQKPQQASPTEFRIKLNDAIKVLRKFSLIHRDSQMISLHRLVQKVLRESMSEDVQRQWAIQAIYMIDRAFPYITSYSSNHETQLRCEQLLAQVLVCAELVAKYQVLLPEAARLLNDAATYLTERARYSEAETLYHQAIAIRKTRGGLPYAQTLLSLGRNYMRQSDYSTAEEYLREAYRIQQPLLDANDPDIAVTLNSLAELYDAQGNYARAERYYEEALTINQLHFTSRQASIMWGINCLATLYFAQKKYDKAKELYTKALEMTEKELGQKNAYTAKVLHDWGEFCKHQGEMPEAEQMLKRALDIRKEVLSLKHPDTAASMNSLAELYEKQGKTAEARDLYEQALTIRESVFGRESPDAATSMSSLATFYKSQGQGADAEGYYKQALAIREKKLGLAHPLTMQSLQALADFYKEQQRLIESERLYKKALDGRYRKLKPDDPTIQDTLQHLIDLYQILNKPADITRLYEEAYEQRIAKLGVNHPSSEQMLRKLLKLYEDQQAQEKILQLYQRTFRLRSRKLNGTDGNSIKAFEHDLKFLANVYKKSGQSNELEKHYIEAFRVCSSILGVEDRLARDCYHELMSMSQSQGNRQVVKKVFKEELAARTLELRADAPASVESYLQSRKDLAELHARDNEQKEVEQTYEDGLTTCYHKLGLDHPRTIQSRYELVELYEDHKKPADAERIYREALAICMKKVSEHKLSLESPQIIEVTNDLANCYIQHKKYVDAALLVENMFHTCEPMSREKPFPTHYTHAIVYSFANKAQLSQKISQDKKKSEEARLLFERALNICEVHLGKKHDETKKVRTGYIAFLRAMGLHDLARAIEIDAIMMEDADHPEDAD